MNARILIEPFGDLFSNRTYISWFYLMGTIILGLLGMALERRGVNNSLVIAVLIAVVVPLNIAFYQCKKISKTLLRGMIVDELEFYRYLVADNLAWSVSDRVPRELAERRRKLIAELTLIRTLERTIAITFMALALAVTSVPLIFFIVEKRMALGIFALVGLVDLLCLLRVWHWIDQSIYRSKFERYEKRIEGVLAGIPEKQSRAGRCSPAAMR